MKEFIMWTALFLMVLGSGFIILGWPQAGITTLLLSLGFCTVTGMPYFAKREVERGEYK